MEIQVKISTSNNTPVTVNIRYGTARVERVAKLEPFDADSFDAKYPGCGVGHFKLADESDQKRVDIIRIATRYEKIKTDEGILWRPLTDRINTEYWDSSAKSKNKRKRKRKE